MHTYKAKEFRTKERYENGWVRFDKICFPKEGELVRTTTYQKRIEDPDSNSTYHVLLNRWPIIPNGLLEARALYYQPGCTYRHTMSLDEFLVKLGFDLAKLGFIYDQNGSTY